MAKSNQELWIGFLGLVDYFTERWEQWSFDLYDFREEIMERGEMAEEDFRGFLREINTKPSKNANGEAPQTGEPLGAEEQPALEQTKADPLRETLKRGQMKGRTEEAEVVEEELDEVMHHLKE